MRDMTVNLNTETKEESFHQYGVDSSVVERAAEEIGYPPEEKMLIMHIETVDFKYRREKTAYVFKDAHKIFTEVIN